jgi:hypothetical protein
MKCTESHERIRFHFLELLRSLGLTEEDWLDRQESIESIQTN